MQSMTVRDPEVMKISLDNFCKGHKHYGPLFKSIPKETRGIAYTALAEMPTIKPGIYDLWWATQHNRFIRDHKQRDLLVVHEVMYHFASAFARGALGDSPKPKAGATKK